jgi:serine/threonine protein kinase
MALTAGMRFGSCEVLAQIGAGGMCEVYQVWDTRFGREVAIKVLPGAFAHYADRNKNAGFGQSSEHRHALWAGATERHKLSRHGTAHGRDAAGMVASFVDLAYGTTPPALGHKWKFRLG